MKFGDLLEEFIFLVFKYQRKSKGIDYFQSAEDEEFTDQSAVNDNENLKDQVKLHESPKAINLKVAEQQYEMCTVVEESIEEEGEESPLNKKIPSPNKFSKQKYESPNKNLNNMEEKTENSKSKVNSELERSPGIKFFSPVIVPNQETQSDVNPDHKKYYEAQDQMKRSSHLTDLLKPQKIQLSIPEELVKIENLISTHTEEGKEAQSQDSKTNIIEKLESKIFKLLREAKKQIERSKERKEKSQKLSLPLLKSARNSTSKNKETKNKIKKTDNMSFEITTSPEKKTAYKLIQGRNKIKRI